MSTNNTQTRNGRREGPAERHGRGFPHIQLRRDHALARNEGRGNRTPEEQLALLDDRLGRDVGAARERKQLLAQIAEKRPRKTDADVRQEGSSDPRRGFGPVLESMLLNQLNDNQ